MRLVGVFDAGGHILEELVVGAGVLDSETDIPVGNRRDPGLFEAQRCSPEIEILVN